MYNTGIEKCRLLDELDCSSKEFRKFCSIYNICIQKIVISWEECWIGSLNSTNMQRKLSSTNYKSIHNHFDLRNSRNCNNALEECIFDEKYNFMTNNHEFVIWLVNILLNLNFFVFLMNLCQIWIIFWVSHINHCLKMKTVLRPSFRRILRPFFTRFARSKYWS